MKIITVAKTRNLLRQFKKSYKKLGMSVYCNSSDKCKDQKWVLFSGENPVIKKPKALKRFNVVNRQAIAA